MSEFNSSLRLKLTAPVMPILEASRKKYGSATYGEVFSAAFELSTYLMDMFQQGDTLSLGKKDGFLKRRIWANIERGDIFPSVKQTNERNHDEISSAALIDDITRNLHFYKKVPSEITLNIQLTEKGVLARSRLQSNMAVHTSLTQMHWLYKTVSDGYCLARRRPNGLLVESGIEQILNLPTTF